VDVDAASAEAIADTVEGCPTGALRYERLDGAPGEQPQRPTIVIPIEDGPLMMLGDLEVKGPDGDEITHEGRLTLCRCGMSRNQPFCDNSHLRRNWESGPSHPPAKPPPPPEPDSADRATEVVAREDASLELRGDLRIYYSDDRPPQRAGTALLCRCGKSRNKPFCDGSHEPAGFRSTTPDPPRDRLEAETPAAFTPNPRVPDPHDPRRGDLA
jgi:CDGSH-type Zn-finger protein